MSSSEKVQVVQVLEPQRGQRLDNFLMSRLKGLPRSRLYRLIRRGEVRVNKKRCKPERKLELGDQVRIPPFSGIAEQKPGKLKPGLLDLLMNSVLFEDEHLLVINKPSGLSVHGGSGVRLGLIEAMRQVKPEWAQLELAHRLDRETTGCLVIAKNEIFLKHIQSELKLRNVTKHYLALVHGKWPDLLVEVNAPLQKNELNSGERIVKVMNGGKASITRFRVLARYTSATLVEAMPETGRTHQIRVHCQYAGYPIVGDSKYTASYPESELKRIKNLCLHAFRIRFNAPHSQKPLEVTAPMDNFFENLIAKLTESIDITNR